MNEELHDCLAVEAAKSAKVIQDDDNDTPSWLGKSMGEPWVAGGQATPGPGMYPYPQWDLGTSENWRRVPQGMLDINIVVVCLLHYISVKHTTVEFVVP